MPLATLRYSPKYANITWLTPNLATGGDLSIRADLQSRQITDILTSDITHVFDARCEAEDSDLWDRMGIAYLNIGTDDFEGHHIPRSLFDQAVEFAREASIAGGRILAHCHMGINRGPSVAAAILMDQGMDPIHVLDLIKERRPQASIYYFMDAYDAHVARTHQRITKADRQAVLTHWNKLCNSTAAMSHTMRAIRTHRTKDRIDFNQR